MSPHMYIYVFINVNSVTELLKFDNLNEKHPNDVDKQFTEDVKVANKHEKATSFLVVREIQIKRRFLSPFLY